MFLKMEIKTWIDTAQSSALELTFILLINNTKQTMLRIACCTNPSVMAAVRSQVEVTLLHIQLYCCCFNLSYSSEFTKMSVLL